MPKMEKAVAVVAHPTAQKKNQTRNHSMAAAGFEEALTLTSIRTEARVDSRLLARHLGTQHRNTFELIENYKADFAQLGVVRFETGKPAGAKGGRPERYALLTEDQAYLLLTYSRNTVRVRELKVKLVRAFAQVRKAAAVRDAEYLPAYHAMHGRIADLAADSPNARFVHMNVNRLINAAAGIDAGQRRTAALPKQAMLIVAQTVAAKAVEAASDHHQAYQRAKHALGILAGSVALLDANG